MIQLLKKKRLQVKWNENEQKVALIKLIFVDSFCKLVNVV